AGQANAGSIFDPGGNIDRQGPLALNPTAAATSPARFLDDLARALATRAGPFHGKKALGSSDPAVSGAHRAGLGLTAFAGTAASGGLAWRRAWDADLGLLADEGLFQGDFQIIAQIRTASASAAAAPAAHELAEHLIEDVGKAAASEIELESRAPVG